MAGVGSLAPGPTTLPALPPSLGGRVLPEGVSSSAYGMCHYVVGFMIRYKQNPLLAKEGAEGGGSTGVVSDRLVLPYHVNRSIKIIRHIHRLRILYEQINRSSGDDPVDQEV